MFDFTWSTSFIKIISNKCIKVVQECPCCPLCWSIFGIHFEAARRATGVDRRCPCRFLRCCRHCLRFVVIPWEGIFVFHIWTVRVMVPIIGKVSEGTTHKQQHRQIIEAVNGRAIITTTTHRFQGWGKVVGFEIAELRLFINMVSWCNVIRRIRRLQSGCTLSRSCNCCVWTTSWMLKVLVGT